MSHRQAYAPRTWPIAVAGGAVAGVVVSAGAQLGLAGWEMALLVLGTALFVGGGLSRLAWAHWRRKHPPVGLQGYVDAQRRAAPFN
jgi:hypothetical protein